MGTKIHQNTKKPHGSISFNETAEVSEAEHRARLLQLIDSGSTDKLAKLMDYINTEEDVEKYKKYVEMAAKEGVIKAQYFMAKDLGRFSAVKLRIYQKAVEAGIEGAAERHEEAKKTFKRSVFCLIFTNFLIIVLFIAVNYYFVTK